MKLRSKSLPASGANDWTTWKKTLLNPKMIRDTLFTNPENENGNRKNWEATACSSVMELPCLGLDWWIEICVRCQCFTKVAKLICALKINITFYIVADTFIINTKLKWKTRVWSELTLLTSFTLSIICSFIKSC